MKIKSHERLAHDAFAAAALSEVISNPRCNPNNPLFTGKIRKKETVGQYSARVAYDFADQAIKERRRRMKLE